MRTIIEDLRYGLRLLRKTPAFTGVAVGVPAAVLLASFVRSQLFGVSSSDPLTLGAVCLLVLSIALVAAALPARRAAKVDPMVALRYE